MEGMDHLAHERNKTEFDVDAMKIVWAGSRHAFELSDRMARLVASDPKTSLQGDSRRKEKVKKKLKDSWT
uniref:Uncharacterized protein n=1 Tax=Salix viminalis TaxID=40686 RepID=A0A6N2K5P9_SALVM